MKKKPDAVNSVQEFPPPPVGRPGAGGGLHGLFGQLRGHGFQLALRMLSQSAVCISQVSFTVCPSSQVQVQYTQCGPSPLPTREPGFKQRLNAPRPLLPLPAVGFWLTWISNAQSGVETGDVALSGLMPDV